ncbi:FH1/FH2 domain-containing protein 3 isoform X2 [Bombina bombina]|uniref:FH1/FH2 domain-containing protein 3 isoform X2 n=1 Tax=Bombina bombina TaxID=8345 RepID=UPI00235B2034|nr:FH1/FH2 domain-containing protein 3 isoform X2 [Bombina bombina]
MATFVCRVQFLDDTDPFNSTNFPEPTRPPLYSFREDIPIINQIVGVHRLLKAPHKIDDCTFQLSHNGTYLDLDSTLEEQRDDLEGFQDDTGRGKKNSIILRTKLSIRAHACIEKLYSSDGRELRRALFSLKQVFQDDKDLVHEFVMAEGLKCLVKVGAESDQNYQNYILRALGQIMLYVDGMNGIINHNETIQWLYTLVGSKFRLVVKTALKLLLVFVEYTEGNSHLLIQAVFISDMKKGVKPWTNFMEILKEKDGVDTELLVDVMTLLNKTLTNLPDQDSFYDVVDCLEELGMGVISNRHLNKKGTDLDLVDQFNIYEMTLKHEDGDENVPAVLNIRKDRRKSNSTCGLVRRRSLRQSLQNVKNTSPVHANPNSFLSPNYLSPHGQHVEKDNGRQAHVVSNSCYGSPRSPHQEPKHDRSLLGGLLTSSYRQHQESLASERERRRQEREERLQRIEREERNKFNRDYLDKREEQRHAREERYKNVEKQAAEEYAKEIKNRTIYKERSKPCFDVDIPESEPTSTDFTKDTCVTSIEVPCESPCDDFVTSSSTSDAKSEEECEQESIRENQKEYECEIKEEELEQVEQIKTVDDEPELDHVQYTEDHPMLSEKEKHNEESNEKDNCSASSISSTSSTLEREEKGEKNCENETDVWSDTKEIDDQCVTILDNKRFMLDMLYSNTRESGDEDKETEDEEKEKKVEVENENEKLIYNIADRISILQLDENIKNIEDSLESQICGKNYIQSNSLEDSEKILEKSVQARRETDHIWDQLIAEPKELRIKDMDFTDLGDEDDIDVLNVDLDSKDSTAVPPPPPPPMSFMGMLPPPPPPISGCFDMMPPSILPPPLPFANLQGCFSPKLSRNETVFMKKKKTIRLFWDEVRPFGFNSFRHKRYKDCLWSKLEPVKLDTSKLEYLFESKSKELPVTKKSAADGKRQEIIVLDSKRSNAINIGLTVLPPPRTIKMAILNFDEYALNKEGIDKLLTMIPTEEEKQKIQEAQLSNPDIPLGSAEQFLLTLSSVSELSARLHLWAFKMDYELAEKEIAEPLFDLKEGMDQLENNKTLIYILSTLLAIGNFLNGTNAKAFDLNYLQKAPEVKDTVHKQSLLYHLSAIVMEKFPDSTDLYSEIGAITRSAKVDFEQLQDNLHNLERKCKASWDYLKIIAKHEITTALKQKMTDFLKDCAERILILKIVHKRIINRFHSFLLFMGHPSHAIHEVNIHKFCKTIAEFALEYRTSRDRVLQQKQKWTNCRERNRTRGKMITDTDDEDEAENGSITANQSNQKQTGNHTHLQVAQGLQYAEDAAEHENMMAMLKTTSVRGDMSPALRSRNRSNRSRLGSSSTGNTSSSSVAADEILDQIVESATQVPNQRALARERRRSRANRKTLRRTLKSGLTPEEAISLGLISTSEMQI